jgi:hypothetical protein
MTTEIQTTITPKTAEINPTTSTINSRADFSIKMSSTLEERKGNAIKPLSLRPLV